MSTPANPLASSNSGQGIFGKIGSFIRQNPDVIEDVGDRLAAAFGNYAPLQMTRQRRADLFRVRLDQSQMDTAALNRQFLQKQIDNYQTPDQVAQSQVNVKRAETPTSYQTDEGQIGIADTDLTGKVAPRMVNVPNPEIALDRERTADFNRNFPGGQVSTPPPTMPPTVQRPAILPQQVGFHVTGYDANNNPIVESYSKSGAPMGTAPAPTPPNIAVPTSAWKTYLETDRRNGMSDADIVNGWNTQESTRTGIKMVPQPDGSVVPSSDGGRRSQPRRSRLTSRSQSRATCCSSTNATSRSTRRGRNSRCSGRRQSA